VVKVQPALIVYGHYLIINFVGIQVAHSFESGSSAKFAIETTAYLTGYAGGGAGGRWYEYRLYNEVIMKSDRIFDGPVCTALHAVNLDMVDDKIGFQHFPGLQGNVGHIFKRVGSFGPQPLIHLVAAKGLVSTGNEELAELFFGQSSDVFFTVLHGVAKIHLIYEFEGASLFFARGMAAVSFVAAGGHQLRANSPVPKALAP